MSKVITGLKQIQADAHALFVKLHNYHWNVKGMDFMPMHTYTQELYEKIAILYDDAAERVLQLGDKPHLTTKALLEATQIPEETADSFTSKTIATKITADMEYLLKSFQDLGDAADEADDSTTVGFADEHIAILEKDLWILRSMIG